VAASPRPPSWAIEQTEFNAGVLGETALPRRAGGPAFAGRAFARIWDFGCLIFPRSCGTCLLVVAAPTPAPTLIGAGRGRDADVP